MLQKVQADPTLAFQAPAAPVPPAEIGTMAANAATAAAGVSPNALTAGVAKGAMETLHTAGAAAGKLMPESWRDKIGLPSSFTEPDYLESANGAETAGKVGENIAEFALGDAALKGLQISTKLGIASKLASMAKSSPYIARMLELGMNALRQGAVIAPQQMLHGATPGEAAKTGASAALLGWGTGAVVDAAGEAKTLLDNLHPEIRKALIGVISPRARNALRLLDVLNPKETEAAAEELGPVSPKILRQSTALSKLPVSTAGETPVEGEDQISEEEWQAGHEIDPNAVEGRPRPAPQASREVKAGGKSAAERGFLEHLGITKQDVAQAQVKQKLAYQKYLTKAAQKGATFGAKGGVTPELDAAASDAGRKAYLKHLNITEYELETAKSAARQMYMEHLKNQTSQLLSQAGKLAEK